MRKSTLSTKIFDFLGIILTIMMLFIWFYNTKSLLGAFIFLLLIIAYYTIGAMILGDPCPACKRWKAVQIQSRFDLGNDREKIFYKCQYCGQAWEEEIYTGGPD